MGQTNIQHKIVPINLAKQQGGVKSRMDGCREWVSIIACVSASGMIMTPAVMFKGGSEQVGESWVSEMDAQDQSWVTATKKGWTSKEMGLKWLVDVFDPETRDLPNNRIRLLLMDGHNSHVDNLFIDKAHQLRIRILILPPHSTHRLQPLDVGVFSPLSTAFTVICDREYLATEGRVSVNKARWFRIFLDAWKVGVTGDNARKAFIKSGLNNNRSIVMDKVFPPHIPPRTPSPTPTDTQLPPSSPLRQGSSRDLIKKVRSNKKSAPAAVVKMNKRILELEAESSLLKKTCEGLRAGMKAKTVRTWRPIVDGQGRGQGCFIGPDHVERSRVMRDRQDQENREKEEAKQAKKDDAAAKRASIDEEKKARKGKGVAIRAHVDERRARKRIEMDQTLGSSTSIPIRALAGMPTVQATPGAGPSNYAG